MSETIYNANLNFTPPLAVNSFISTKTPGNVAVCLSGGGSRSMVASMGQLLALETLQSNNASLLSQSMMLTSVSGSSWAAVPFVFLPSSTTDSTFLNGPYTTPGSLTVNGIATLPNGCIASGITDGFSLPDLAAEAFVLYQLGAPANMLWNILIGVTFLFSYGLFQSTAFLPTIYFTYDQDTEGAIKSDNSGNQLATETPNMVAQVSGQTRPYFLCMMGMTVPNNGSLVPVQATPFFTGIVGSPNVEDVNQRLVGGGGVTSFGFNSVPTSLNATSASLTQSRQWTLGDITGTSGAAFAHLLTQYFADFAARPPQFAAALSSNRDRILDRVTRLGLDVERAATIIDNALSAAVSGDLVTHQANLDFDPDAIVPSYQYWSPAHSTANETVNNSFFDDGGSLDNTGIASTLAYSDVQNVIAFINSETLLTKDSNSVIVVDQMIPPLFGYQPYDETLGYVLYTKPLVKPENASYANNQVFASSDFQPLLNGLWAASGSGTYQTSPIFSQSLTTLVNSWFGVAANQSVKVLWVYLENTLSWSRELSSQSSNDVSAIESGLVTTMNFPHYSTMDTELTATEIQLLANLTAWTVMNNAAAFQSLYS